MSRTGLDTETLARSLRARAGDGSIEWVCEPIQTSVLLDIADMLAENAKLQNDADLLRAMLSQVQTEKQCYMAENAKLRELCVDVWHLFTEHGAVNPCDLSVVDAVRDRLRELGVEV